MNDHAAGPSPDPTTTAAEPTQRARSGPNRRQVMAGIAAATLGGASATAAGIAAGGSAAPQEPVRQDPAGRSPWGYETYKEPTPAPVSLRPGEQELPAQPRRYTDIKSYHA